jgi:hypothetical protein
MDDRKCNCKIIYDFFVELSSSSSSVLAQYIGLISGTIFYGGEEELKSEKCVEEF